MAVCFCRQVEAADGRREVVGGKVEEASGTGRAWRRLPVKISGSGVGGARRSR